MSPKEAIGLAKAKDVKSIDFKFTDIQGTWHHFAIPVQDFNEAVFKDGLGFDASSIRGWCAIEASDMLIIPDPNTAFLDPFVETRTLSFICDVEDPLTRKTYDRSPRSIAKKAMEYLRSTGLADEAYIGPEAEFFVFDHVSYKVSENEAFYKIDSSEAIWNTDLVDLPNQGYKIRYKHGYLPVMPADQLNNMRNEMVHHMMDLGLNVERQHHEVATAGQCEIDIRYDSLVPIADKMCIYKYIVRNVAHQHGKTATFMPKPMYGDNGSGMHVHISLWKDGKNLMAGDQYAGLSSLGLWFIGGLLKHASALCAICNPTNNSYKRLVPGFEAPVNLAYSARNRSAICRIPMSHLKPNAKRIEFRCPDPSANPYLAFSAILLAGLDGIQNKIDPGSAVDKNLYSLSPEDRALIKTVPESLKGSIQALEKDMDFLLKGGVFTESFLSTFIHMKLDEYDQVRIRPHPMEYQLYFDV